MHGRSLPKRGDGAPTKQKENRRCGPNGGVNSHIFGIGFLEKGIVGTNVLYQRTLFQRCNNSE